MHDQVFEAEHALGRALRFLTAGSVDDGKSTLIGRMLLDSKAILADQWHVLQKRAGEAAPDLSLLTDGLEAEREQGITIDVAYRYFATEKRKFIIADAPGHEQYTRNMVTAASGSDAAVILIDITKLDLAAPAVTLLPQTRRHTLLAHLLRVPSLVFAVNKLDACVNPMMAFAKVREAVHAFASQSGLQPAGIVPVSALRGDNVAVRGFEDWYEGPSLLALLEDLPVAEAAQPGAALLPVQWVQRLGEGIGEQHRVFWGRLARGNIRPGDTLQVLPSGTSAVVREVLQSGAAVAKPSAAAAPGAAVGQGSGVASAVAMDANESTQQAGQSIGIVLDRQLDISRGDWLAAPQSVTVGQRVQAVLAWMDTEPARLGRKYLLRHGHRWVQARVTNVQYRFDIHTLQQQDAHELGVNDIGCVELETQQPIPLLPYASSRTGGAAILVDPSSHHTSGALMFQG